MARYQGYFCRSDLDEPLIEWVELYRPGGLLPIELGQFIDSNRRFEVYHKYEYGSDFTMWITKDHVQRNWKLVKILTAEASYEGHPELMVALALKNTPRQVLQDNYIIPPSEFFWADSPNGRHLCLVFPVLDHRIPLDIIDRGNPETLVDLCFQVATAVAFLHERGICHGGKNLSPNQSDVQITYLHYRLESKKRPVHCRHRGFGGESSK